MTSFNLSTPEGLRAYLVSPSSFLSTVSPPTTQVGLEKGISADSATVERVSGGLTNHTYRVTFHGLSEGHDSDTDRVAKESWIVKYSPAAVAFDPTFELTTKRSFFEYMCISHVPSFPLSTSSSSEPRVEVGTATPIHYDDKLHFLCMSDASSGGSQSRTLKQLLIDVARDSSDSTAKTRKMGTALGEWLAQLHTWGESLSSEPLRSILGQTAEIADAGAGFTFGALPADDVFWKEVREHAERLQRTDDAFLVHGDFWTGNIIVSTSSAISEDQGGVKLTVLDWEASSGRKTPWNDLGQMCAEMYQPTFFYDNRVSPSNPHEVDIPIISSFLKSYLSLRTLSTEDVRMTIVRCGVHVFVWPAMTAWGDQESVERCKGLGRELAERAWNYDWEWVGKGFLRELVKGVVPDVS